MRSGINRFYSIFLTSFLPPLPPLVPPIVLVITEHFVYILKIISSLIIVRSAYNELHFVRLIPFSHLWLNESFRRTVHRSPNASFHFVCSAASYQRGNEALSSHVPDACELENGRMKKKKTYPRVHSPLYSRCRWTYVYIGYPNFFRSSFQEFGMSYAYEILPCSCRKVGNTKRVATNSKLLRLSYECSLVQVLSSCRHYVIDIILTKNDIGKTESACTDMRTLRRFGITAKRNRERYENPAERLTVKKNHTVTKIITPNRFRSYKGKMFKDTEHPVCTFVGRYARVWEPQSRERAIKEERKVQSSAGRDEPIKQSHWQEFSTSSPRHLQPRNGWHPMSFSDKRKTLDSQINRKF